MRLKRCQKCHLLLPMASFSANRSTKDGRRYSCKQCAREYYLANKERICAASSEWNRTHKERRAAKGKEWRAAHPQRAAELLREWYKNNRERAIADSRAWRKSNPERALEQKRAWYRANPEVAAASKRAWRIANIDHCRELARAWRKANPEKNLEIKDRRRARKRDAFVEYVSRSVVIERDKGICGICKTMVSPDTVSLDHIVPLARGGKHSYRNVQLAHRRCNSSKNCRILTTVEGERHAA